MNKTKKLSGIYLFILFASIIAASALRTAALLRDYNYGSGYFEGSKALINAAGITVSAFALLLFTFIFTAHVPEKLRASYNTSATYIPVGAIGAALVFFAANAYSSLRSYGIPLQVLLKNNTMALSSFLMAILAICACVFFIANALITEKSSLTRAFFGICTVIFLLFYFAFLYFDTTLPINAPNKIIDELAYISAAAFFLFETRISLDRERWRSYITFGFIASLMTAYSAIPSVIVYFANGEIISNSIFETALTLTLFLFIITRTILATNLPEDRDNELVTLIKQFSKERADALDEKHAIEKRAYLEVINRLNEVEETHSEPSESELFDNGEDKNDKQISIFDETSFGGAEENIPSDVESNALAPATASLETPEETQPAEQSEGVEAAGEDIQVSIFESGAERSEE